MVQSRDIINKMADKENAADFKKVKEYLGKHPLSSVMEVSTGTGVMPSKIASFVSSGMLKVKAATKKK